MSVRLKHVEDVRTIIFEIALFVTYVMFWNSCCFTKSDIIKFGMVSLQCFQSAVVVHNCAHTHPFKDASHNYKFFLILTLLSGAPVSLFVPGHNQAHHKHLETEKDATRTNKMKYRSEFLNFMLYVPTIVPRVIINEQRYMLRQCGKAAYIFRQYKQEVLAYYSFLVILLLLNWRKALVVYILPSLGGKFCILSLNMLQHYKCDPTSQFNHSRNFTGPVLNFLFMNNGYHTVHHNAPGLHWSKLPTKHLDIEDKIHPDLIQKNILQYTYETHFRSKATTRCNLIVAIVVGLSVTFALNVDVPALCTNT